MTYVRRAALGVDAGLDQFVAADVLAPLGTDVDRFWEGYAEILQVLGPRNDVLLGRRQLLQQHCDEWHERNRGTGELATYIAFLEEVGYLEPEPAPFRIDVHNLDGEISSIAGPQLVVPLSSARFALNAANARWGSLYDAMYGSDAIAGTDGAERAVSYNPRRGQAVIDRVNEFLDEAVPLASGRHADVVGIELTGGASGLALSLRDGTATTLRTQDQFIGHRQDGRSLVVLLRHHGLHLEIVIDHAHPIGRQHPAGVADVVLEAALTTVQDCEDSVAAVDAEDKVAVYRNWLGLMNGSLEATFEKDGAAFTRRLAPDRYYTAPDGTAVTLPGRSLLLVRNVGMHMMTDAVRTEDGVGTPEGFLDAMVTVAIGAHDLRGLGRCRNSTAGSIYIVKPKLHGSAEVRLTVDLFAMVERVLGLPEGTVKIGVMDEERRTSANLAACIAAAQNRLMFINTGFLDRTGDEIHTVMAAGAVVRKDAMRSSTWLRTYEDRNVDIGLRSGLQGVAQIGKGMWAMPDAMAEMVATKVNHPLAGASCAWVPSPTAAVLHAMHYHQVDVAQRQDELLRRPLAPVGGLFAAPLLEGPVSGAAVQEELESNAQSILGYVVRWVDQGIGCSKVPDLNSVGLMEDRATLRISSQLLANWLHHGLLDEGQVHATFLKMAAVVDEQNRDDLSYQPMTADPDGNPAFQAALELVLAGRQQPNGYTEATLGKWRRVVKARPA